MSHNVLAFIDIFQAAAIVALFCRLLAALVPKGPPPARLDGGPAR